MRFASLYHTVPPSVFLKHGQRSELNVQRAWRCVGLFRKVGDVIIKTTKITVRPDKHIELVQTMGRLLGPIKNVKGCRTIRFYLDAADENSSLLLSEWESESDLNRYLRSNDFAILRGAIMVLSVGTTDSKALVTSERIRKLDHQHRAALRDQ
jgi:quinol monooxygenase YgiN